jgi:glycosyltransferase involved in cell wall biosynthesis
MESLPLRRLVLGPTPSTDRIFFTSVWFRDHNNPRYAELLPRLRRLDPYLFVCSRDRLVRGIQYRTYRAATPVRVPALMQLARRRYRSLFTVSNEQIPWFAGPIVVDVDDPFFTEREVELLSSPNLAAYVVTAERAGRRLQSLGVEKPYHVIPQGVSLRTVTPELIQAAGRRRRATGEVIVGYMAAFLLAAGDRGGESPLYNVDHLLDLWEEVHLCAPAARLWLVGGASERVRERVRGREDILLLGRLPRDQALAHTANFDIALYPRTKDQGVRAAKVAEYMGLGVPTVSYDFAVTDELRETGAGVLVPTPAAFVEAVVHLIEDASARRTLADAATAAGRARDWDLLARRYEDEILDCYLGGNAQQQRRRSVSVG